MTYHQLFSALLYAALRFGLLAEMLALKALGDIAGAVNRWCLRGQELGQKQLAMLPGGVE